MRMILTGMAMAALLIHLTVPASAKTATVTGRIVDESCYKMDKANAGVDHKMPNGDTKECAIACAKLGHPMALLTSDGKVYEITGSLANDKNAKIISHVGHMVEVTGDVMDHDGKMMIAADTLKMVSK